MKEGEGRWRKDTKEGRRNIKEGRKDIKEGRKDIKEEKGTSPLEQERGRKEGR